MLGIIKAAYGAASGTEAPRQQDSLQESGKVRALKDCTAELVMAYIVRLLD